VDRRMCVKGRDKERGVCVCVERESEGWGKERERE
jgi:hypothetical protein